MARHGCLRAAVGPNVVSRTVAQEPSAVAPEPGLEVAALHSANGRATTVAGGATAPGGADELGG
jgi:hypothetical protein